MRKVIIVTLWLLLLIVVGGGAIGIYAIWEGKIGYLPDIEELQNPISRYASQIYTVDGKMIGTWSMSKENRVHTDYANLSPYLVRALVATEDVRFYDHSGIDFKALARAVIKRGLMGQTNAGGGSTITQQLAKQLYSNVAHSTMERAMQKPIEWVIAVQLERYYTKREIIALYLNYFDFLHNAVGIKTAATTYFGKDPYALSLTESALLIGMCKNPSYYNPMRYPERALGRRNVVLSQMRKAGYITGEELAVAKEQPLGLNFHRVDHNEGSATYFREFLRLYMSAKKPVRRDYPEWGIVQYKIDSLAWETDPLYGWCNKNKKKDGSAYNIYTDGLKIYTTIDSRMQTYAEEAVYDHVAKYLQPEFNKENRTKANAPFTGALKPSEVKAILKRSMRQSDRYRALKTAGKTDSEIERSFRTPVEMTVFTYNGEVDTVMTPMDSIRYYKKFLRAGFMSMDARTGAVKAYVGGLNYSHFKYDMVTTGRRQVGSTTKPYLYALSMENGLSPCDLAPNVQKTYGDWTPRNSSQKRYGEMVTLKWGLAQSNNWISAYLMSLVDPRDFVNMLGDFGICTYGVQPTMALCLGPNEVSVAEMVGAYSAFANKGMRSAPMFVSKIEDSDGRVLATFQPRLYEVISEESAYKMVVMLRGVIDGGTGGRIRFRYDLRCDMGGKTGTTNRNSDAWFMGFTPSLVNGCWVGGEERDIHFDSMRMGQGANMALPIWAMYMKKVYADKSLGYSQDEHFDMPEDYDPCIEPESIFSPEDIEEVYE